MAEQLVIVIKGDNAQFTRTMRQVDAAINRAQGSVRQFGHSTVSNTQAASASIRLLEGNLNNMVRAAENFIGRSQVLSSVLKTAFPVVGAIAVGAVIAEGIQRLQKFIQTAQEMPQKISNAWNEATVAVTSSNDELQLQLDQTKNKIAELMGHKTNDLAIMFDDAKISADNLVKSVEEANKQLNQLITENQITTWQAVVTGEGTTKDVASTIKYWGQELQNYAQDYFNSAQDNPKSPETQAKYTALMNRLNDAVNKFTKADEFGNNSSILDDIQNRKAGAYSGKQDAAISMEQGFYEQVLQLRRHLELTQALGKAKPQLESLEAQKQAQEKMVQDWRDALDRLNAIHQLSVAEEARYWLRMAGTVKFGTLAYQKAFDEAVKLTAQANKERSLGPEDARMIAEGNNLAAKMSQDYAENVLQAGEKWRSYHDAQAKAAEITAQNTAAMKAARIELDLHTFAIDKHDAAVQMAAVHETEFNAQLAGLRNQRALAASDTTLKDQNPAQYAAQLQQIDNLIAELNGRHDVTQLNDAALEKSTTALGEFREAVAHTADELTDFSRQLSELVVNTLQNLNSSLSEALMAHYNSGYERRRGILSALSGTARTAGSQGLNDVFQQLEGAGLKALLGKNPNQKKPKGTPDDPIYVKQAGQGSGSSSGIGGLLGKLMGKFFGGGSSILDLGSGGMGSLGAGTLPSIFGGGDSGAPSMDLSGMWSGMDGLPAFADGGDPLVGRPNLVGERGPELFVPRTSGTIIPNHQLGGDSHSWYIDARGNDDPGSTIAQFDRLMRKSAPQLAAMGIQAKDDHNRRLPPSRRT